MTDLTNDLVPLFDDKRIEKKLIDDQKKKEETAQKNRDMLDQVSNT